MNIIPNFYFGISGFVIWYLLAPRKKAEGQPFLAYTIALLISLLISADLFYTKPVAFFFNAGGSFAFLYFLFKKTITITIKTNKGS